MIDKTIHVKKIGAGLIVISAVLVMWRTIAEIFGGGELTDIPFVFGMSLFGLVPGLILYFTARQVLKYGPSFGTGLIAVIFSIPLMALAIGLHFISSMSILMSIAMALVAICVGFWGVAIIRRR